MEREDVVVQCDPLLNDPIEQRQSSQRALSNGSASSSNPQRHEFLFKIAILGNSGSGKTCLLKRFTDDSFNETPFLPTIGIDFRTKILSVDDRTVKLQVWDTAGKSRFESLGEMFLSEAMGVIFCFDITDRKSFKNLSHWMNKFIGKPKKSNSNQIPCVIVGCKQDLGDDKRMVTKYEAQSFAVKHGSRYAETSAKLNTGIDDLFASLASSILSQTLKDLKDLANPKPIVRTSLSNENDVAMRSGDGRQSLRQWSQRVSMRTRSIRKSFRVRSHKKKKKEKGRIQGEEKGEFSVAFSNKEGNDEARILQATIRRSTDTPIDMRNTNISSDPLPEDTLKSKTASTTTDVIEDNEEFKPKFKFCCM